jgi:transposase
LLVKFGNLIDNPALHFLASVSWLQDILEAHRDKVKRLILENLDLRARLRWQRIEKYGPAAEALSDAQLELLELEPGVNATEIEAEAQRAQLQLPLKNKSGERKPPAGRQPFPPELPRVEQIIACPAEQCLCGQCGQPTAVIGYETAEQLDREPAKYFVRVLKREKRACSHCGQGGVQTATLPARIIEKSIVSNQVIIDTVVAKYCDYAPLYRQSAILQREVGLEISRTTMCDWMMQVGELLRPIRASMRLEVLAGDYIQADETPLMVQVSGLGRNHRAYLWQYSRPGGSVVFDFQMGRGREGPRRFLGNYEGILQTDGYSAYDQVGGAKLIRAGCWSHARRKFFQALQVDPQEKRALELVTAIDELFSIEARAREDGLDAPQRLALRQVEAGPWLEKIKSLTLEARKTALPRSRLAEGCDYLLKRWNELTCFLQHGQLELSTNLAENAIRPIALGRKNWIHLGCEGAGPRIAAIISVIETCRRLQIRPRDYLGAILPGLADFPAKRVAELAPLAWVQTRH